MTYEDLNQEAQVLPEEMLAILDSHKKVIDALIDKTQILQEQIDSLEGILFDDIINPAIDSYKNYDKQLFIDKYEDKFKPYKEQVKLIDGVDLGETVYDEYMKYEPAEGEEPMSEEEFVEGAISNVAEQLKAIKASLGIPEEAKVEVVADTNGDGETDTVVAETETETEVEVKPEMVEPEMDESELESIIKAAKSKGPNIA